jgi:putative transposase
MPRPRVSASPFRYFKTSPEVIRLSVLLYVKYPLSLRNVEDLLAERGIDISHETVRYWWNRFGPLFAADIRRQRVSAMRGFRQWRWHLDEMYVKVNGEMRYLWRAVDHEGEILESFVTKERDKAAAMRFMKKALKRHGSPEAITTDGLRSYKAAMTELGNTQKQEVGRWANNRVERRDLPRICDFVPRIHHLLCRDHLRADFSLTSTGSLSEGDSLWLATVAAIVVILVTPVTGIISDRIGRKPVLLGVCALSAVLPVTLFSAMAGGIFLHALAGAIVLACVAGAMSAVGAVSTAEQFPGEGRVTGLALGATGATAIFGGLTPYVAQRLVDSTGNAAVPGIMIAVVALFVLPVFLLMTETRSARP